MAILEANDENDNKVPGGANPCCRFGCPRGGLWRWRIRYQIVCATVHDNDDNTDVADDPNNSDDANHSNFADYADKPIYRRDGCD